ncbi:double-strand break repair protein AddB [Roseovarius aestuariivivens]|uniref:double-strand break repair protein AddB n=1 Tax=Roseovarius aestuariivivens TaxID=1888910 RepID=UPI00108006A9|nr:double-strand break repair protein AddB [Roseovarius aestuariivivens]
MFEPTEGPRVFGVPLGADFPLALVDGLRAEYADKAPDALARVHLIVNTRRMARRVRALFDAGPPCLLPRISLVTDFGELGALAQIPDAISPLRRRLELVQLVAGLLEAQPDLAPRSALYDLADSLAGLMDEMHGEGVHPDQISSIDTGDQSGHWDRIKSFLGIIRPFFDSSQEEPDVETRQRMVIEYHARLWAKNPPSDPVIVAGSTGSRGATRLLMEQVSMLPNGAVVLPGFDFDQSQEIWNAIHGARKSEEHPQFRFADFMAGLGASAKDVRPWPNAHPRNPERNRLISLALRPAPVTDQWLLEGPSLASAIEPATRDMTLVEAPNSRMEALAIAMRLRQAAEDGQTAALITPDRMLTRQVTAALDRWGIVPDDSAGMPLHQSAPGRFLRHIADLFRAKLSVELLLTLLKHPLTHSGVGRGPHLRFTRELELFLRRHGPPYPTAETFTKWAAGQDDMTAQRWADWITTHICNRHDPGTQSLDRRLEEHMRLAEALSAGAGEAGSGELWKEEAGRVAFDCVSNLRTHAAACHPLNAVDYSSLFHAVLSRETVRRTESAHPGILIWGTLEARVQGADLLILAGLNEGAWPEIPAQDPWLNRAMRKQAGLLLPERRIGLAAHDFQQAACAGELWLTRAVKSEDAPTVPSRWINRLQNLLCGLPDQGGKAAFEGMLKRGGHWISLAAALETPEAASPAHRPAPCPPINARPRELPVTAIKHLIRDPYAIYARYVLGLRRLNPVMQQPDPLLRGVTLHTVLEKFVKDTLTDPSDLSVRHLLHVTQTVLREELPWEETRALWFGRMQRAADSFIASEIGRQAVAQPTEFEAKSRARLSSSDFTLTAKADRIDIDQHGALYIYDYKTGDPPTKNAQKYFDKQLLLEAALAERSGFGRLDQCPVEKAIFVSLGSNFKQVCAPLDEHPPQTVWAELETLISAYFETDRGYPSRRAMFKSDDKGEYDHLARFGEWDIGDDPVPEDVG